MVPSATSPFQQPGSFKKTGSIEEIGSFRKTRSIKKPNAELAKKLRQVRDRVGTHGSATIPENTHAQYSRGHGRRGLEPRSNRRLTGAKQQKRKRRWF